MSYLNFNKSELVNLEYSLKREMLSTNRAGGYCSTSIVCCNTRKYHGLLVCPIKNFGSKNHVLLSSLDESIVQHDQAFNLAIHQYPGTYEPKGHKYIIDFEFEPTTTWIYRVGGVLLRKQLIMVHNEEQLLIRYTLLEAHSPTLLRLRPMLAFRGIHQVSKANLDINTHFEVADNGIASKLYNGYPSLFMQISKENEFIAAPDWHYNVEYHDERERGFEFQEDLYTPGYFEMSLKKGESIVFSASLEPEKSKNLDKHFSKEVDIRPAKDSLINCLLNTATQFIYKKEKTTEMIAGYPWYRCRSRDTFVALPGLTLAIEPDVATCKSMLNTCIAKLKDGMFPTEMNANVLDYSEVDTPLWFFWSLQKLLDETKDPKVIWKDYGVAMKTILNAYKGGAAFGVTMHENCMLWVEEYGKAQTWMNAVVDGQAVTPRYGYPIEVNALWYNAISFALELAEGQADKAFIKEWSGIKAGIKTHFLPLFWIERKQFLADYVDAKGQSTSIRPNQLFVASLPYSPVDDELKRQILQAIKETLLTPKGIRTLCPKNSKYIGQCVGNQKQRDQAAHQGTVWPWLLGHYVEANFKLYGDAFLSTAEDIAKGFVEDMTSGCICSIPEIYDGDPPHEAGGAMSQAWSIATVLRIITMINQHTQKV